MPFDPERPAAITISEVPDTPPVSGGGAPEPEASKLSDLITPDETVPKAPPKTEAPAKPRERAPLPPNYGDAYELLKACKARAGSMIGYGLIWCGGCGAEPIQYDMGHRSCPSCDVHKAAKA